MKFFNKIKKKEEKIAPHSKEAAKERLHLVLMQDRANVSADFLELMKQEIIEVIKKYIEIDEGAIDVRLTNKENEDGTNGAPALYANIPILNIKNEARKIEKKQEVKESKQEENEQEASKEETKQDVKENEEETKNQEDKIAEKNVNKEEKVEDDEKNKDGNLTKTEDKENKEDIAEDKETNEELNQKK